MTDEHLAVEDQETSKIERRERRREDTRESEEIDESGFERSEGKGDDVVDVVGTRVLSSCSIFN